MATDAVSSESEWLLARLQCEQLFLDFHGLIDAGRAILAAELFSDDGVFEVRGRRHEGMPALTQFLAAREADTRRRTRHLASNFRFAMETGRHARATANLSLFTADDDGELKLEAVVDCELRFERAPSGRWLTQSRRHARFATASQD
jgi:hypothetical protein